VELNTRNSLLKYCNRLTKSGPSWVVGLNLDMNWIFQQCRNTYSYIWLFLWLWMCVLKTLPQVALSSTSWDQLSRWGRRESREWTCGGCDLAIPTYTYFFHPLTPADNSLIFSPNLSQLKNVLWHSIATLQRGILPQIRPVGLAFGLISGWGQHERFQVVLMLDLFLWFVLVCVVVWSVS
jgi:hypothetical protein